MTYTYKLHKGLDGVENSVIRSDGKENWQIPFVAENKDYEEYLEWVAEGNTADPAD